MKTPKYLPIFILITSLFLYSWAQNDKLQRQENITNFDPLKEFRTLPHQDLEKDFVDKNFEQKIFNKIKGYVNQSKTELFSFYTSLTKKKEELEYKIVIRGGDYNRISPQLSTNIYQNIINFDMIRNHFYLDRTIERLLEVEKLYNFTYESLRVVFSAEELNQVAYDIQSLLGTLYLYKGLPYYLKLSIERFNFLLGENPHKFNFVESNPEREQIIYENLLSIYIYLAKYYQYKDFKLSARYRLRQLENAWKLLKINYAENPKILEIKQRRLLSERNYRIEDLSRSPLYGEFVTHLADITGTPMVEFNEAELNDVRNNVLDNPDSSPKTGNDSQIPADTQAAPIQPDNNPGN